MRSGEFVRPLNNVPVRLVLTSMGVLKGGFCGLQKLFQLADARSLYLDMDVAQQLEQMVSIGQEFWLCKRKPAGKGQKARWDIYLEDPTSCQGESELERDLRLSIEHLQQANGKNREIHVDGRPPNARVDAPLSRASEPERPPTKVVKKAPAWAVTLVNHTNDLIDAYAECLRHSH